MTLVRLNVIGRGWGGTFNYPASTCWLIDCALAHNSCLTKIEKKQVRDLLYQYKDAFSLRDEIGLCPNIEIEIDVTDKSPFFIRPFHANEEDKVILDKEMK